VNLIDYAGNVIRLTDERLAHIKEHPEMVAHTNKISDTLVNQRLWSSQKVMRK
jgi:hypothetical protein